MSLQQSHNWALLLLLLPVRTFFSLELEKTSKNIIQCIDFSRINYPMILQHIWIKSVSLQCWARSCLWLTPQYHLLYPTPYSLHLRWPPGWALNTPGLCLHWGQLFPLPFLWKGVAQVFTQLASSFCSGLCSNIIFSERSFRNPLIRILHTVTSSYIYPF